MQAGIIYFLSVMRTYYDTENLNVSSPIYINISFTLNHFYINYYNLKIRLFGIIKIALTQAH